MKTASVFVQGKLAGRLEELEPGRKYRFIYQTGYCNSDQLMRMKTV